MNDDTGKINPIIYSNLMKFISQIKLEDIKALLSGDKVNKGESERIEFEFEYCWACGGYGQRRTFQTDSNPDGWAKCHQCKGTGYGESYKTYCRRMGFPDPTLKVEPTGVK